MALVDATKQAEEPEGMRTSIAHPRRGAFFYEVGEDSLDTRFDTHRDEYLMTDVILPNLLLAPCGS